MNIIALYSKKDFRSKFNFHDSAGLDFLFSSDLSVLFKKYDYYIIPNSPTVLNVVIITMLFSKNMYPCIFVDSILEPLHVSWWKRWKRLGITGAFQFINESTFHPMRLDAFRLPIAAISSVSNTNVSSDFRCLGITVPNTVSYEYDHLLQIKDYFKEIVSYCESNGINYIIRDRNNFFKNDDFFLSRIDPLEQDKTLNQFFEQISHLVTCPGSLVLQAGINNIIVCQILNTFLFANTPSAYIVTVPCPITSWINNFLFSETPNHAFQRDYYYHLFSDKSSNSSLKNLLRSSRCSNVEDNHLLVSPFELFMSFLYWHIRLYLKNLRNRFFK